MGEIQKTLRNGCLICLVQASNSMRHGRKSAPVATKIDAALHVVDQLVVDLVQFAGANPENRACFEVGVLAYSTNGNGGLDLRPLLPGSARGRPLVPLSELVKLAATPNGNGQISLVKTEPSGLAPAREALTQTRDLLEEWTAKHSGAVSPVLVHFTDGESSDGPITGVVASFSDAIPGAMILHCLFRAGIPPSLYVPIPETPCGDLWAMSSPFDDDEVAQTGTQQLRSLFVNKLSAARTIGRFIRKLWSRSEASAAESPLPVSEKVVVEEVVAAEPEDIPEPEPADVPEGPGRFELRALWAPKGGNDDKEWEDGYASDAGAGVVAVADGAGDGIFSKLWADLLLESFINRPIPLDDPQSVEPWIQERRRAWLAAIRYPEQRWSIQMKIDRSCGAATFVGLVLDPVTAVGDNPADATGWRAWAVGDACLFHIRGGRLIASFPMGASSEFGTTPQLYQSKALRPTPVAVATRGELLPDDLIVFATDALAQRLLAEVEAGAPPDWGRFWDLHQDTWRKEIAVLREQNAIVNDDCTLLVLRLAVSPPGVPAGSETEQPESPGREPIALDIPVDSSVASGALTSSVNLERQPEHSAAIEDEGRPAETLPDDAPNQPHPSLEQRHD